MATTPSTEHHPPPVPTDTLYLPQRERRRAIAGASIVEWHYVVVYVHSVDHPHEPPTFFYFQFYGNGDYYLDEVATLVDQWTFFRGQCLRYFPQGSHEYNRAKQLAARVVGTYRRNYLARHGTAPNPLLLQGTLDENLVRRSTLDVLRSKYGEALALQGVGTETP